MKIFSQILWTGSILLAAFLSISPFPFGEEQGSRRIAMISQEDESTYRNFLVMQKLVKANAIRDPLAPMDANYTTLLMERNASLINPQIFGSDWENLITADDDGNVLSRLNPLTAYNNLNLVMDQAGLNFMHTRQVFANSNPNLLAPPTLITLPGMVDKPVRFSLGPTIFGADDASTAWGASDPAFQSQSLPTQIAAPAY